MEFDDSLVVERVDDLNTTATLRPEHLMTLHCAQCNAVLADSLGLCGELKCIDSVMCMRVTNDVVVSGSLESVHKGEMADCICSVLKCRLCSSVVGKHVHAAPSHLAATRFVFLLSKAKMSCYILDTSSMVKASSLSFELKPLQETVDEARRQCEVQLDLMAHTCSLLADMSVNLSSRGREWRL
ncbi:protein Mis18-beta [Poeciliopsis prolifica]|uniref:protein Mis18-beta n=1 Tax=Poeciliopsis prolifica TaxID=188132 RepID=UPI00241304AA|nr:protein Mis18-beta [Poeciliopsis prolifica]